MEILNVRKKENGKETQERKEGRKEGRKLVVGEVNCVVRNERKRELVKENIVDKEIRIRGR